SDTDTASTPWAARIDSKILADIGSSSTTRARHVCTRGSGNEFWIAFTAITSQLLDVMGPSQRMFAKTHIDYASNRRLPRRNDESPQPPLGNPPRTRSLQETPD